MFLMNHLHEDINPNFICSAILSLSLSFNPINEMNDVYGGI